MKTSEYDQVKENLLIEGLQDWITLGNVHTAFMYEGHSPKRPLQEAQDLTPKIIRELVSEGLFVFGVPSSSKDDPTGFTQWNVPLEAAMASIEDAYVGKFADRWGWTTMVWLSQTDEGEKLALKLYHADEQGS
jgi:hypothetical protein